jgi:stage II sporulation protein E
MVAPLLSEILGEPIGVFKRIMDKNEALVTILLGSLQKYTFKTGVAKIAKEGGDVSGDSYCYMPLGTGKYLIALSDGMGTGDRAHDESLSAINLLRKLLRAGVDVEKVLDTVNAILRLRSKEEMFATLDLAVIDTSTGMGSFVKVGSTPGFIKHKKGITPLVAQAPPAGILARIEVKPVIHKLQADDFLIMMTDGAYDALEQDLPALLKQITVKDSQLFADQVLARVLAQNVNDDVTVLVSKMEPYVPEWATFSSCR